MQSLSETIVKITRSVEKIAMAWFFTLNQQASNNEDVVTSSKLTAANVGSSCLFIWFQRQMDNRLKLSSNVPMHTKVTQL